MKEKWVFISVMALIMVFPVVNCIDMWNCHDESRDVLVLKKVHIPRKPRFSEKWKLLVQDSEHRHALSVGEAVWLEAEVGEPLCLNACVSPLLGNHFMTKTCDEVR